MNQPERPQAAGPECRGSRDLKGVLTESTWKERCNALYLGQETEQREAANEMHCNWMEAASQNSHSLE